MQARKLEVPEREKDIASLYGQCRDLLRELDDTGLHHAAAYVSMALDAMSASMPALDAPTPMHG